MGDDAAAVLITGAYGTGKSTVTEEIASIFEETDTRFAAIDLDWLIWTNVPDSDGDGRLRLFFENLVAVVDNFRAAGVTRFVLAGWVADQEEIDATGRALRMPLSVVRLEAPIEVIERRLLPSPTGLRQQDLAVARQELADGHFAGLGDLVVDSDRPITDVANEILDWLGWR